MANPLTPQQFGEGIAAPLRNYGQAMVNKGFAEQQMASDADKQAREERRMQAEADRQQKQLQQNAERIAQRDIESVLQTARYMRKDDPASAGFLDYVGRKYPDHVPLVQAALGTSVKLDKTSNDKDFNQLNVYARDGNIPGVNAMLKRLGYEGEEAQGYIDIAEKAAQLNKEKRIKSSTATINYTGIPPKGSSGQAGEGKPPPPPKPLDPAASWAKFLKTPVQLLGETMTLGEVREIAQLPDSRQNRAAIAEAKAVYDAKVAQWNADQAQPRTPQPSNQPAGDDFLESLFGVPNQ